MPLVLGATFVPVSATIRAQRGGGTSTFALLKASGIVPALWWGLAVRCIRVLLSVSWILSARVTRADREGYDAGHCALSGDPSDDPRVGGDCSDRRCGKPNCRCADGEQLHETTVLSYSEAGAAAP